MKILLCIVLLLIAPVARAELFELNGALTCGFPTPTGKLTQTKYSSREIVAAALSTENDPETTRRFAFVYNSDETRLEFVERCDGSQEQAFASNQDIRTTMGEPRNGKIPYTTTQLLQVTDWDVSVENGMVTCNFSGNADANTIAILTAKGTCIGALTIFEGEYGYCSLKVKLGKPLKVRNDCPT